MTDDTQCYVPITFIKQNKIIEINLLSIDLNEKNLK